MTIAKKNKTIIWVMKTNVFKQMRNAYIITILRNCRTNCQNYVIIERINGHVVIIAVNHKMFSK